MGKIINLLQKQVINSFKGYRADFSLYWVIGYNSQVAGKFYIYEIDKVKNFKERLKKFKLENSTQKNIEMILGDIYRSEIILFDKDTPKIDIVNKIDKNLEKKLINPYLQRLPSIGAVYIYNLINPIIDYYQDRMYEKKIPKKLEEGLKLVRTE